MGIGREMQEDALAYEAMWEQREGSFESPKQTRNNWIWRIKSGENVKVVSMEDSHIYHAFNCTGDETLFTEMVLRLFESRIDIEGF